MKNKDTDSDTGSESSLDLSSATTDKKKYNLDKESLQELSDGLQQQILGKLPEGYSGALPDHLKQGLPMPTMNQGQMGMPQMSMANMSMNMAESGMNLGSAGMDFNSMSGNPSQKINSIGKTLGVQSYVPPEQSMTQVPQLSAPSMSSMPSMSAMSAMPQMGQQMPMGMPQMGQQMSMGMSQMMPQMMPQMGGSKNMKVYKFKSFDNEEDFFF
jgi:hypothetical protein